MKMPSREIAARAEEAREAEVTKTARLRALRLAKENAGREAAQDAAPIPHGDGSRQPRRAKSLK